VRKMTEFGCLRRTSHGNVDNGRLGAPKTYRATHTRARTSWVQGQSDSESGALVMAHTPQWTGPGVLSVLETDDCPSEAWRCH
jgi:hypothetical protein